MTLLGLENLTVHRHGRPVLQGIDLRVGTGELVGLLGPNGAGKTTLLRGALGLLPHGGRSSLDALTASQRARHAAFMPQGRNIAWPLPVERLVALGRSPANGPAVERAIAALDLGPPAPPARDRAFERRAGPRPDRADVGAGNPAAGRGRAGRGPGSRCDDPGDAGLCPPCGPRALRDRLAARPGPGRAGGPGLAESVGPCPAANWFMVLACPPAVSARSPATISLKLSPREP